MRARLEQAMDRVEARRGAAGAVFVESIILISFFTMTLMGTVYMHRVYTTKLRASRVARASIMRHAMIGCPDGQVQTIDGAGLTPNPGRDDARVNNGQSTGISGSSEAQRAAGGIAGTGGFFLNPIRSMGMSGNVSVTSREGMFSPSRGFTGRVNSTSHASCPDPVRNGDFDEVIGYIRGVFF